MGIQPPRVHVDHPNAIPVTLWTLEPQRSDSHCYSNGTVIQNIQMEHPNFATGG